MTDAVRRFHVEKVLPDPTPMRVSADSVGRLYIRLDTYASVSMAEERPAQKEMAQRLPVRELLTELATLE